jgi:hypothetical protein
MANVLKLRKTCVFILRQSDFESGKDSFSTNNFDFSKQKKVEFFQQFTFFNLRLLIIVYVFLGAKI